MDSTNNELTYNVAQLLKERVGSTRKLDVSIETLPLYEDGDEDLDAHDLEGTVKVTNLGEGVLVQGDVKAIVHVQCSRCLTDINLPVEGQLEEQFRPTVDVETGRAVQRQSYEVDDTAFDIDANHIMDLTEPVRQALLVAMDMRPLCREDCKGLCPECGANRNDVDCGHEQVVEDSRWAALRELDLSDLSTDRNKN
ncbi:MAG TPA: DUF177 domain-containing protein [Chloroflexia bacterium]|nr:DUF177 domain-containing protein [Chloroflexia bacterium]